MVPVTPCGEDRELEVKPSLASSSPTTSLRLVECDENGNYATPACAFTATIAELATTFVEIYHSLHPGIMCVYNKDPNIAITDAPDYSIVSVYNTAAAADPGIVSVYSPASTKPGTLLLAFQ